MTWLELFERLRERLERDASFGDLGVTVYCAGSGEYYGVDDVVAAGEGDGVVDPDALLIVIQD